MPNRPASDPNDPDRAPAGTPQPIDIDDASIDETARVNPDEELKDLANPEEKPAPKMGWRERDANRRGHGADDLKA